MFQKGYYKLVLSYPEEDEQINKSLNDLFFVYHILGDIAFAVNGETTWEINLKELEKHFEFIPNGSEIRQQQIAEIMRSLHESNQEQNELLTSSADAPHISQGIATGFDLVVTKSTPLAVKGKLQAIKVGFAKTQLDFSKKQQSLQRLIEEQALVLKQQSGLLQEQIKKATECIDVIQTYLGENEEIFHLRKGKSAEKETKIVLRQLILFMDEESQVAVEKGGIDFRKLEDFDGWIKQPKNLKQTLPEEKGIVAFRISRQHRKYSEDPWSNAEANSMNKQLYLLIRNGENLYRILPSIHLHDVLFPRKDEFEDYFYHRNRDGVREPMEAGSREYIVEMEKFNDHRRDYFKLLILLQGLLDRTKIFHPMKEGRINICDLEGYNQNLQFVYDGENLLAPDRPDFKTWLKDINSKIDIGQRVIGEFNSYYALQYDFKGRTNSRWANRPDSHKLYTIENREDTAFIFYYLSYHKDRKRKTFRIYRDDKFLINFDAIPSIDDMRYYINSRTNRQDYLHLIPLMRLAIELKEKEARAEEPFRKLLIGQIHKIHQVSLQEAGDKIDELISWWKFKNFTHRALTSDDSKALRMIVDEFGKRQILSESAQKEKKLHDAVCRSLLKDEPNTLAVFHRKENEYAVFHFCNNQNIFVTEEHWDLKQNGDLNLVYKKEWKTVDKRYLSWNLLWQHGRWNDWAIGARIQEHLTDAEVKQMIDWSLNDSGHRHYYSKKKGDWNKLIYVKLNDDATVDLIFAADHCIIPKVPLLKSPKDPTTTVMQVSWEKKRSDVQFFIKYYTRCTYDLRKIIENSHITLLYLDESVLNEFEKEETTVDKIKQETKEIVDSFYPILDQISDVLSQDFWQKERAKFFEEYPDEDLWLEQKKKIHEYYPNTSWMIPILKRLYLKKISPIGLTVSQALVKSGIKKQPKTEHLNIVETLVIQ